MSPSTAVIQFKKYLLVDIIHPICNLKVLNEITSNRAKIGRFTCQHGTAAAELHQYYRVLVWSTACLL